jgi:hypothetical protein
VTHTDDAHLGAGIPEADRLDQELQVDPAAEQPSEWPIHAATDVDEADRLEQAQDVIGDPDEEYTPQAP